MEDNNLQSQPAQLKMTVSITRKATGKVETYELFGTPLPAEPEEPKKEPE